MDEPLEIPLWCSLSSASSTDIIDLEWCSRLGRLDAEFILKREGIRSLHDILKTLSLGCFCSIHVWLMAYTHFSPPYGGAGDLGPLYKWLVGSQRSNIYHLPGRLWENPQDVQILLSWILKYISKLCMWFTAFPSVFYQRHGKDIYTGAQLYIRSRSHIVLGVHVTQSVNTEYSI